MAAATTFRLNNVRIAFANLFDPKQVNGEGKFRCGCTLLVEPGSDNDKKVIEAIKAAADGKWGAKAKLKLDAAKAKGKVSYSDGNLKDYDGFAGMMALSANCQGADTPEKAARPSVFNRNPNDGKITNANDWAGYSGCYVNAMVNIYADDRYGEGVFCSLSGVQFAKDGDAFGAASAKSSDFDTIEDGTDAGGFTADDVLG